MRKMPFKDLEANFTGLVSNCEPANLIVELELHIRIMRWGFRNGVVTVSQQ